MISIESIAIIIGIVTILMLITNTLWDLGLHKKKPLTEEQFITKIVDLSGNFDCEMHVPVDENEEITTIVIHVKEKTIVFNPRD